MPEKRETPGSPKRPTTEDLAGITIVIEGPEDTTIRPISPERQRQIEEFRNRHRRNRDHGNGK